MSKWAFPPVDGSSSEASTSKLPNPPLYASSSSSNINRKGNKAVTTATSTKPPAEAQRDLERLREAKAWDLALGPAKQVPMQAFMVYMSGGGLQIFSMMIIFQLIKGAISGMMSVNTTFAPLLAQTVSAATASSASAHKHQAFTQQKIVHCLAQGLLLGLGLYKCHTIGLLPTHESDFLAFRQQAVETSSMFF